MRKTNRRLCPGVGFWKGHETWSRLFNLPAPVVSKELRKQVAKEMNFRQVIKDPDVYKAKLVLWGGVIIGTKNVKEATLIEVLGKSTDRRGRILPLCFLVVSTMVVLSVRPSLVVKIES